MRRVAVASGPLSQNSPEEDEDRRPRRRARLGDVRRCVLGTEDQVVAARGRLHVAPTGNIESSGAIRAVAYARTTSIRPQRLISLPLW
jgi:hypothetical protein